MLDAGLYKHKIEIYEQQLTPAYEVSDGTTNGYVKIVGTGTGVVYVVSGTKVYNDIKFTTEIATASGSDYYYKSFDVVTNDLGEIELAYNCVKSCLFTKKETRVGGLLSGRPADTVMTSVTDKFTWRYKSFSNIQPNKHKIKYDNEWYDVNYSLKNEDTQELEVFTTKKV